MFEIKSKLAMANAIILIAILNNLGAIQITNEFYLAENKPKEYETLPGDDCTVVTLKGWHKNSIISVSSEQLFISNAKQGSMKTNGNADCIFVVPSSGYVPGMPVVIKFKDSKKRLKDETTIIPNRIYVKSSTDAAQIEAKVVAIQPITYAIMLEGFKENEELLFHTSSYDEEIKSKIECNQDKTILFSPEVVNKQGGIARINLVRLSGENLKLELPWGIEWVKYLQYFDKDGTVKTMLETDTFRKSNPEIVQYFKSKR